MDDKLFVSILGGVAIGLVLGAFLNAYTGKMLTVFVLGMFAAIIIIWMIYAVWLPIVRDQNENAE